MSAAALSPRSASDRKPALFAGVIAGMGVTLALWTAWWLTHIPPFALGASASFALFLGVVFVGFIFAGRAVGAAHAKPVGTVGGLTTALVSFLILGSKLVEQPQTTADLATSANQLQPTAPIVAFGFLAACALAGLAGAILGGHGRQRPDPLNRQRWLARLAAITTLGFIPLILVGGTVTSADAGMAVPDAVTTYGAISFFFPASLMREPRIFLEHSHRLFGTLVGLMTIALMIATFLLHPKGWKSALAFALPIAVGTYLVAYYGQQLVGKGNALPGNPDSAPVIPAELVRVIGALAWITAAGWMALALSTGRRAWSAAALFALVTVQGVAGIIRVDQVNAVWASLHGVSAQIIFGVAAALAALSSPLYMRGSEIASDQTQAAARRALPASVLLFAVLMIQLFLGAIYRHLGQSAFLWIHATFALVVCVVAVVVGFVSRTADARCESGRPLRLIGWWLLVSVFAQFTLGFLAMWQVAPSRIPLPDELATAHSIGLLPTIIATAHQTNGAILMGLAALSIAWNWRLRSERTSAAPALV